MDEWRKWHMISSTPNLSIEFLRREKDNLIWRLVQKNTHFTQEMLIEFADVIDWHLYAIMQPYQCLGRKNENI